ncbi:MAG: hypothetical protein J1D88_06990 [Treponema sp.]|nr:hypothetical protein [Treponema sp.]
MRRFFANLIVLVVAAAAVFFVGWVQFAVKPGNCAVMVSKTGGVHEKPVLGGVFTWRWERLLPTNLSLRMFETAPYESRKTVSGELPSAELYAAQLFQKADFSYRIDMKIQLSVQPQQMVALVRERDLKGQEELESYLEVKADLAARAVAEYLLAGREGLLGDPLALSGDELAAVATANRSDFNGFSLVSVDIVSASLPDLGLYMLARESFINYQARFDAEKEEKLSMQVKEHIEQDRILTQLEVLGSLLQKYPQLDELSKNGDITSLLNALRNFR